MLDQLQLRKKQALVRLIPVGVICITPLALHLYNYFIEHPGAYKADPISFYILLGGAVFLAVLPLMAAVITFKRLTKEKNKNQ